MLFKTRRIFDYLERPKQKNDSKGNWNYCYEVRKIASTKRLFKKKEYCYQLRILKKIRWGEYGV